MTTRTSIAALIGAVALLAVPGAAYPSATQRTVIQDDVRVLRSGPEVRDHTLDEIRDIGAEVVKITVPWREFAPPGPVKPAGFDGSQPSDYAGELWAPYDDAIRSAQARGLEVFLMLSGPAPDWASERSNPVGVQRPDAAEFGRFVQAVGMRYSGLTGELPEVNLFSIWNEPNLPRFLLPQRSRRIPVSPHIYRDLLIAAHAALEASSHGGDTILLGELLPVGRRSKGTRSSISPLEFLREMACVDGALRKLRGRAARRRRCPRSVKLPGDGLAYHPYTQAGGPSVTPRSADDATIGTLDRVTNLLDRLGARRRLAQRRMPLYLTEFGFQTDPPDRLQTPIARVPSFLGHAEWLAVRNRRVAMYSQYPLVDDAVSSGFQSGLRFASGEMKTDIYEAFKMPIYVRDLSATQVEVFGGVRAPGADTGVVIEARVGKSDFRRVGSATLNSAGYFRERIRIPAAGARIYRFHHAGKTSRQARAGTGSASRKSRRGY